MNEAQIHLMVNHFPIIAPIVGLILWLISLLIKNEGMKKAASILWIIGALSSAVSMKSGEEAEEQIESYKEVSHDAIEEHEESAEKMAWVNYMLGLGAAVWLWASVKNKSFSYALGWALVVICAVSIYLGYDAGHSGGLIRHPEISNTKTSTNNTEHHD